MTVAALLAVTVAGIRIGGAVVARHRAQAAADLAALAAAQHLAAGPAAACRAAEAVAAAMGAAVGSCGVGGLDVVVSATVRTRAGQALASARAGPP